MLKILTLTLISTLCINSLLSQNLAFYSQFYEFDYIINPAFSGKLLNQENALIIAARDQWTNFGGGNPRTFSCGLDLNIKKVGLGLRFTNDFQGNSFSSNGVDLSLSPHIFKINSQNYFRFGIGFNFHQNMFDVSQMQNVEDNDPLLLSNQLDNYMNFNTGFVYDLYNRPKSKQFSIGFSFNDLLQKDLYNFASILVKIRLGNLKCFQNFNFTKVGLIQNNSVISYGFNLKSQSVDLGLFVRNTFEPINMNAAGFILGIPLSKNDKVKINYSSEFSSSALQSNSDGTHEVFINIPIQSNYVHSFEKREKNTVCNPVKSITIIDPADRNSNKFKIDVNNNQEYNLLDDELINYDFDGFEFNIDKLDNEKNISYEVLWKDGFTDSEINYIDRKSLQSKVAKIDNITDYDKIIVEIQKVCKNRKSDVFKVSFIPN